MKRENRHQKNRASQFLSLTKLNPREQPGNNLKKNCNIYLISIFSGYMVHLTKSVKRISEGVRKSKLAFLKAIEDAEKANTKEERSEILDKLETFIRWEVNKKPLYKKSLCKEPIYIKKKPRARSVKVSSVWILAI